jgi:DNA mismatch endonuclease, patch repair protein
MVDVFDVSKRSEVMSLIRSKNTKAELLAFRYLRRNKIYFQKHYPRAPGKPDIALPRKKKAVFIDSDFWHGHTYDKILRNRPPNDYWIQKIARNMERDTAQRNELRSKGWQILIVWEADLKRVRTRDATLIKIKSFLTE